MIVYILSDHDEHGAENVRATTDKRKLPAMLIEMQYDGPEYLAELARLLQEGNLHTNGGCLGHGWGGAQLHVIELEP